MKNGPRVCLGFVKNEGFAVFSRVSLARLRVEGSMPPLAMTDAPLGAEPSACLPQGACNVTQRYTTLLATMFQRDSRMVRHVRMLRKNGDVYQSGRLFGLQLERLSRDYVGFRYLIGLLDNLISVHFRNAARQYDRGFRHIALVKRLLLR